MKFVITSTLLQSAITIVAAAIYFILSAGEMTALKLSSFVLGMLPVLVPLFLFSLSFFLIADLLRKHQLKFRDEGDFIRLGLISGGCIFLLFLLHSIFWPNTRIPFLLYTALLATYWLSMGLTASLLYIRMILVPGSK